MMVEITMSSSNEMQDVRHGFIAESLNLPMGLQRIICLVCGYFVCALCSASDSHSLVVVQALRVHGVVDYRCYPGPGKVNVVDEVTGRPCDGRRTKEVVIDESISIPLTAQSSPGGGSDLDGVWERKFDVMGRWYTIGILITQYPDGSRNYRITAFDEESSTRRTAVHVHVTKSSRLQPITIEYGSERKKEEVQFSVLVEQPR